MHENNGRISIKGNFSDENSCALFDFARFEMCKFILSIKYTTDARFLFFIKFLQKIAVQIESD